MKIKLTGRQVADMKTGKLYWLSEDVLGEVVYMMPVGGERGFTISADRFLYAVFETQEYKLTESQID